MYQCRNCGHEHTDADWVATPTIGVLGNDLRACHACGSLAVLLVTPDAPGGPYSVAQAGTPPETPPEAAQRDENPYGVHRLDERRAEDQGEALGEAFVAGTLPEAGRRDDDPDDDVAVPDDIQVDDVGVEVRRASKRPRRKKG